MANVAWQLEHAVEVGVSAPFAWNFWTNVSNWDDPPASLVLEGATLSRGALMPCLTAGRI
jgi:hypothetical protein